MATIYSKSTHLVLDIETLGTKPGCVVTEIGMVVIKDMHIVDSASWKVDIISSIYKLGMTVDKSTAEWWSSFPDDKIDELINQSDLAIPPNIVTELMSKFLLKYDFDYFWGNSPDFDYNILNELVVRSNRLHDKPLKMPWEGCFWKMRDVRTLISGSGMKDYNISNSHSHEAIFDATYEAQQLLNAFQILSDATAPAMMEENHV